MGKKIKRVSNYGRMIPLRDERRQSKIRFQGIAKMMVMKPRERKLEKTHMKKEWVEHAEENSERKIIMLRQYKVGNTGLRIEKGIEKEIGVRGNER